MMMSDSMNKLKCQQQNKKTKAAGLKRELCTGSNGTAYLGCGWWLYPAGCNPGCRVLTGWTIYPMSDYGYGNAMKKLIDRIGEDKLDNVVLCMTVIFCLP